MNNLIKCMKVVAVFLALGAAVSLCAQSAIEMVTYFPVPYAQYNTITPPADGDLKFDVGTQKGPFELVLGKTGAVSPLTTEEGSSVNLINGTTLNLQTDLYTNTATFGRGTSSTSTLTFENLRINSVPNKANTVESPTWTVNGTFKLKNAHLPGCDDTVQWQKLEGNKWYLVCGTAQGNVCSLEGQSCGCDNQGKWQTDLTVTNADHPHCKCSADYECGYPLRWEDSDIGTNYTCKRPSEAQDTRYDWNMCKTNCGSEWSLESMGSDEYIRNIKAWTNQFTCTQCLKDEYTEVANSYCNDNCSNGNNTRCYKIQRRKREYSTYLTSNSAQMRGCNNNSVGRCITMTTAQLQCAPSDNQYVKNAPACASGQNMFGSGSGGFDPGYSSGYSSGDSSGYSSDTSSGYSSDTSSGY